MEGRIRKGPIGYLHPLGASWAPSLVGPGPVCFGRGGGFVALCWSFRFFLFFFNLGLGIVGAPTLNGALKWYTRNHRKEPVDEAQLDI